jgi:lipid II:glycine glycyltransferase (peptidoglycan interpeptide bridge formation enzyme)
LAVVNDKDQKAIAGTAQKSHANNESPQLSNPSILAGTVLIKHTLPKGKLCWLYSPRGPLLSYENEEKAKEQLKILTEKIKPIAKEERAVFLRIDPLIEIENAANPPVHQSTHLSVYQPTPLFKSLSFRPSHLGFQPEDTLIIDLTKTNEEILKQMKEKGRYNIRLAERKGVRIIEADPQNQKLFAQQIQNYFEILQETTSRDKFYGHGIGFYKNMVEKLSPTKHELKSLKRDPARAFSKDPSLTRENLKKGFAKLYLAEYEGTTLAGIIVTFHKNTAIYYYGASSNAHRNLMAPYLLQWHAMMQAKKYGCTKYDLLGIAPPTKKDEFGPKHHPWRGVTEFKRKFGGTCTKYIPAQELSFKPLTHSLYKLAKKLRKSFR